MSGEYRQHPPTAHRLRKLRQAGLAACSGAVVGVVALGVGTAALLLGRQAGTAWLGQMLARDLHRGDDAPGLPGLLGMHLLAAVALVSALALLVAAVSWWAQTLQTGLASRPLPTRPTGLPQDWWGALLGLVGLVGMGAIWLAVLSQYGQAQSWPAAVGGGLMTRVWLRGLALLTALAVCHRLGVQAQFWRRAWMTESERREELRETEGGRPRRRGIEGLRRGVRDD